MEGVKISFSEKYIAKMFSLKKLLHFQIGSFVFEKVVGNQGYGSRKVYSVKNL